MFRCTAFAAALLGAALWAPMAQAAAAGDTKGTARAIHKPAHHAGPRHHERHSAQAARTDDKPKKPRLNHHRRIHKRTVPDR